MPLYPLGYGWCSHLWGCFRHCWATICVWQPCWSTKLLHCVGTPSVGRRCTTPPPGATPRSWPICCRPPQRQLSCKTNCWTTNNTPRSIGLRTKVRYQVTWHFTTFKYCIAVHQLLLSSFSGHEDCLEVLLEFKTFIHEEGNPFTPLHCALWVF